jgi:hypothetical protein
MILREGSSFVEAGFTRASPGKSETRSTNLETISKGTNDRNSKQKRRRVSKIRRSNFSLSSGHAKT